MNYQNNKSEAVSGDDRNTYINNSGAQVGVFTMAKAVTASTGTQGIEFSFKSNDGATANYLTLYTINSKGEQIFGYKQLCGIMTVLNVEGIVGAETTIKEYDQQAGGEIDKPATIYPSLMNQPIGVIFQKEEYYKRDSTVGNKVNMYGFYRASDNAMPFEIGKGLQADGSRLTQVLESLTDKKIKPQANQTAQSNNGGYNGQGHSAAHDFNDDLDF